MKPENTKRMTKWRTDSIYSPKDLNIHDPHDMYVWEERVPVWVWVARALGALGFIVGIYSLVFLGMLL